jgi:hypothetical protein
MYSSITDLTSTCSRRLVYGVSKRPLCQGRYWPLSPTGVPANYIKPLTACLCMIKRRLTSRNPTPSLGRVSHFCLRLLRKLLSSGSCIPRRDRRESDSSHNKLRYRTMSGWGKRRPSREREYGSLTVIPTTKRSPA